jgi:hypothetical protein
LMRQGTAPRHGCNVAHWRTPTEAWPHALGLANVIMADQPSAACTTGSCICTHVNCSTEAQLPWVLVPRPVLAGRAAREGGGGVGTRFVGLGHTCALALAVMHACPALGTAWAASLSQSGLGRVPGPSMAPRVAPPPAASVHASLRLAMPGSGRWYVWVAGLDPGARAVLLGSVMYRKHGHWSKGAARRPVALHAGL